MEHLLVILFCSVLNVLASKQMTDTISYWEEQVVFHNEDSTLYFGATITIPSCDEKKMPALVLLSGTGKSLRNNRVMSAIADYLGKRGVITLRADKRGCGESGGVFETATTADFADDALSALYYLKGRKDLPIKKIGLLGHSEGGAVASVATSKSKEVDFMISMAGLATDGLSALIYQNESIMNISSTPEYNKKRYNEITNLLLHVVYEHASSDSLGKQLKEVFQAWKIKDDACVKMSNLTEKEQFRFSIGQYIQEAERPWYRFIIRYNPGDYLSKIKVPVLALNGDKDLWVDAKENLANFKRYVKNKRLTAVELPNVNHWFLSCKEGTQAEAITLFKHQSLNEDVLNLIYRWIKATCRSE
nr:alpha/beta fold hydrolase [Odoribacter splanchnicus]